MLYKTGLSEKKKEITTHIAKKKTKKKTSAQQKCINEEIKAISRQLSRVTSGVNIHGQLMKKGAPWHGQKSLIPCNPRLKLTHGSHFVSLLCCFAFLIVLHWSCFFPSLSVQMCDFSVSLAVRFCKCQWCLTERCTWMLVFYWGRREDIWANPRWH